MQLSVDTIIKLGSLLLALGTIWTFVKKLGGAVKGISEIKETVKKIAEDSQKNTVNILRLTLMNTEMPISERIIAGQEYIDAGGNGEAKKYYKEYLCHLHEDKAEE